MSEELSHIRADGTASMVDVSGKPPLLREAVASGRIYVASRTLELIAENEIKKGDVLGTARLAGIQGAKGTWSLIPLCHQVPMSFVGLDFHTEEGAIRIEATARTVAGTGVEMEALTAVSVAALTIYDMCKAVDKEMSIGEIVLVKKSKKAVTGKEGEKTSKDSN